MWIRTANAWCANCRNLGFLWSWEKENYILYWSNSASNLFSYVIIGFTSKVYVWRIYSFIVLDKILLLICNHSKLFESPPAPPAVRTAKASLWALPSPLSYTCDHHQFFNDTLSNGPWFPSKQLECEPVMAVALWTSVGVLKEHHQYQNCQVT